VQAAPELFLGRENEMQEQEREQGLIKLFDTTRGYGFITPMLGPDVFFHITAIVQDGAFRAPTEGRAVEFERVIGRSGKTQASNVMIL
jgi:cold shock protein